MELTHKQMEGLRLAVSRYNAGKAYTCISGYAGTGKSTLVAFVVDALGLDREDEVAYIAYTGKAAEVLRSKSCPNAMTAHRLLYYSKQMPNGKYIYKPRTTLDKPYKLIVVDEISMLPAYMWELLLNHEVYILACGDPFQIPPINLKEDNHVLDNPHVFLDEVMRQAKESDIINVSMDIREGKKLKPLKGNDIQIFHKKDLVDGMYFWADQIICSTNRTRRDINDYMRKSENRGKEPEVGDKIICLQNCWETLSDSQENPLINGSIGYIQAIYPTEKIYSLYGELITVPVLRLDLNTDLDNYSYIYADYKSIIDGTPFFTPEQEYQIKKNKNNSSLPIPFNYGYAITGHRAQGVSWEKVLVIEESFPFKKEEHARWLYSVCTRGINRVTIILKD